MVMFNSFAISIGIALVYIIPVFISLIPANTPIVPCLSSHGGIPQRMDQKPKSKARCTDTIIDVRALCMLSMSLGCALVMWGLKDPNFGVVAGKKGGTLPSLVTPLLIRRMFFVFVNLSKYYITGFLWIYFSEKRPQTVSKTVGIISSSVPLLFIVRCPSN